MIFSRGLRGPAPRGPFLGVQKGTKKTPGEGPRSPRHRPPGDTPFGGLFALRPNWFGSMDSAYPSSAAAYRLPTGSNGGPCCGTSVRFTLQRFGAISIAGSTPLRGRQAELDESQTTRSEPRRKLLFTGQSSSSFAERVRKTPVKRRGSSPWGLAPFWVLFVRTKSTKAAPVPPGQSFGRAP